MNRQPKTQSTNAVSRGRRVREIYQHREVERTTEIMIIFHNKMIPNNKMRIQQKCKLYSWLIF